MNALLTLVLLTAGTSCLPLSAAPAGDSLSISGLSTEDHRALQDGAHRLAQRLQNPPAGLRDLAADALLFPKAIEWALRYETSLASNEVRLLKHALDRGEERAGALAATIPPWTKKHGTLIRGFTSAIDGSVQPYGVIVPRNYDGVRPMRLDVVLHGSAKPRGLSELQFCQRFDGPDNDASPPPDADYIELHPLGRVENCYRWAGETDVFEAIEAVCRQYRVDRDRIVVRGMSMGASGTWHLGLQHPDRFVAIGPYCGYVDTHRFSETPIPGFIKVGQLPRHQELGLHMLDSVDYAANAGVVPAIGAIGDKDVFFQAHVLMGEAFAREGLKMVNLISPGTGHVIDPATHAEQMRRIGEYAAAGLNHAPREIRFVTWTLKYSRCHWIEALSLRHHYSRSEIAAHAGEQGDVEVSRADNIRSFAIHPPMLTGANARIRVENQEISIPRYGSSVEPAPRIFERQGSQWTLVGKPSSQSATSKRPGLQGPIDDAFVSPFLCVRGTGRPWNPAVGAWADASLRRFSHEWARYMRGDLPVKDDRDVTEEDARARHLILFGDPGSNLWIRKALPRLPLEWTRETLRLGGHSYSAKSVAPALICPNPLSGSSGRYLVLNSGHTFHEAEFTAFNYLLFPRLGDWAVQSVLPGVEKTWAPAASPFPEQTLNAGFFDENWKFSRAASP
ncbi:MAG: prolyl oligopeptidase family serine peptidase [Verrucomicrobia bacterium]|nr:prolyl oligopeptidase family serine peptidase [Verrucomicrobiota bacterium]MBI3870219.1 prolyl oligopeptidase family serine peptidase [Verrucomicrobiota bacterium]